MTVFLPHDVRCGCGHAFEAALARAVDAGSSPDVRAAILDGTFHRVGCPSCGQSFTVEKSFVYMDLKRSTVISVRPRPERHLFHAATQELDEARGMLSDALPTARCRSRVVFGLQELREKLVAQDSGLDDRLVETLKLYILREHPFLLHKPRLRLVFQQFREGRYGFIASHDHSPESFSLSIPAHSVVELKAREKWLIPETAWVNLWRYSPRTRSLARLAQYASEIRAGGDIELDSDEFKNMVRKLPTAAHMSSQSKQDLETLHDHVSARGRGDVQVEIFNLRFDMRLADDWGWNDSKDDIDTLWALFKSLPESHVMGNVTLQALSLNSGEGPSVYQPDTHEISIRSDELNSAEKLAIVVRHEVGHAVHARYQARVDAWLKSRFGWLRFGWSDADIDVWVEQMGGWGVELTPEEKAQVCWTLRKAMGPGSRWGRTQMEMPPKDHPWWKEGLTLRLAFERTQTKWYLAYQSLFRHGTNLFAVNFWRLELQVISDAAVELVVKQILGSYALMSQNEFFAELYEAYYRSAETRSLLPEDVRQWISENIHAA